MAVGSGRCRRAAAVPCVTVIETPSETRAGADDPRFVLPEFDLLEAAREVAALEPLAVVAAGVHSLCHALAEEGYDDAIGEEPVKEAAGVAVMLSYRALRSVAVLTAAGLSTEAFVHARRLGELVQVTRHLETSGAAEYAREWLRHRKSPSKLLERDFNEALSKAAHAHAGHLDTLTTHADDAFLHGQRAGMIDLMLPYGAAQLGHELTQRVEALLGRGSEISTRVDELVMSRWREAAAQLLDSEQ